MRELGQMLAAWLPRVALFGSGAILCSVGIIGALHPQMISGTAILDPVGTTSIRVDFGGFHLGLGMFALMGAAFRSLEKPALIALFTTTLLVVATRIAGFSIDGVDEAQVSTLTKEILPLILATLGLLLTGRVR